MITLSYQAEDERGRKSERDRLVRVSSPAEPTPEVVTTFATGGSVPNLFRPVGGLCEAALDSRHP